MKTIDETWLEDAISKPFEKKDPEPVDIQSLAPYWTDACEKASCDDSAAMQEPYKVVFDQTVENVRVKGVEWDDRDWIELYWKHDDETWEECQYLWEVGIKECRSLEWLLSHLSEKRWVTPESLFLVQHVWTMFNA